VAFQRVVITRFGDPSVLAVVEEERLPEPGPGEVRVRMEATSASFTDTMIRKGIYHGIRAQPPFSPGYDLVGTVDAVGPGVIKPTVSDRVAALTVTGAYAEYLCVAAADCVPVPVSVDAGAAVCMVLTYLTAYQMLHRIAHVLPGARALVHGAAGAVGTALLQLGALDGLELYGTASGTNLPLLGELGATAIDYRTENVVACIAALEPPGVDAVFDGIGHASLTRSFRCLRKGGMVVSYGSFATSSGTGKAAPLAYAGLALRGLLPNGRSSAFYSVVPTMRKHPDWYGEDLAKLFALLEGGHLRPIISRTMPLASASEAHRLLEGRGIPGKIVLVAAGGDAAG
jgi:NADPH:quinone reductase-like Zn-dependent oxidoreductase